MKFKHSIFWYCTLLVLTLSACSKEQGNRDHGDKALNPLLSNKNQVHASGGRSAAWIPRNSKIENNKDEISIKAPDGWSYAGLIKNGKSIITDSEVMAKISCTCNTTGACKPFVASGPSGSISGCGGECTNCTMLQSVFVRNESSTVYSGGFFNRSSKTRLLKNGENVPAVFEALFEVKEFQQELLSLYKKAYKGKPFMQARYLDDGTVEAPEGYSLVGASIMGRGLLVVLPTGYIKTQLGYSIALKASCGCSEGNCKLKDKSILGVGAIWCDGNCTGTCTLDTSFAKNSQYAVVLSAFRY